MEPLIRKDVELIANWNKFRKKLADCILLYQQKPVNFSPEVYEPVEEIIVALCIIARKIKRCDQIDLNSITDITFFLDIELFNDIYTKMIARIKKYIRYEYETDDKKPMDLYSLLENN